MDARLTNTAGVYSIPFLGEGVLAAFSDRTFQQHNRNEFFSALGIQLQDVARINQVHGDAISVVRLNSDLSVELDADALITAVPGMALSMQSADCLPIFAYDPIRKACALIHAGWRGLEKRIISKTIQKMELQYQSRPQDLLVAIGPSIHSCCYEVGKEFEEYFSSFYSPSLNKASKGRVDLPAVAKFQLRCLGIPKDNVWESGICTSCDSRFFSYRRDKTPERIFSVIQLPL